MAASAITKRVTIANGAALSNAINVEGYRLVSIQMPTSWTAAALYFQGTNDIDSAGDPENYSVLEDQGGTEVAVAAEASKLYVWDGSAEQIRGIKWLKVGSGTSGATVNQGADRVLILSFIRDP